LVRVLVRVHRVVVLRLGAGIRISAERAVVDLVNYEIRGALVERGKALRGVKLTHRHRLGVRASFPLPHHSVGETLNELEGLSTLVPHQTDRRLVDDRAECLEVLVLQPLVLVPDEVVREIVGQLRPLVAYVGEVDEESRAHVSLQQSYVAVRRGDVTAHEEVAVLEEAPATDLLGVARRDEFAVEVGERDVKVSVDRLGDDRRVEVFRHRRRRR